MSFCERCHNLVAFIKADIEASKTSMPGIFRDRSPGVFRLDIKVSLGCSLCALLLDQLSEDNLADLLKLADPFVEVRKTTFYSNPMISYGDNNGKKTPIWNHLELSFYHPKGRDLFEGSYPISVIADKTSDATIQHHVSSNTDSFSSWQWARTWLKKCSSSHPCKLNIDNRLPSRLVQVFGTTRAEYRARLVLSADLDKSTKYCTLSHCWGNTPMFKLLKANFVNFLSDIPVCKLSKTFQDALYAANQLGFSFIWIDSLCIIQDVRDDWLHEAGLMSSVYAKSSLNLAATAAADGRAGLFFNRNPVSTKANYIRPSTALGQGYVVVNRRLWDQSVEDAPLAKRAWVVQERFLAPCTLHFASNQLFWECGEVSCCEMFPSMQAKDTYQPAFYGSRLKVNDRRTLRSWTTWRRITENYSQGSLTKEEDKLFAMAGMATNYHSLTGDTYLAGLWKEGVEMQLLWSSAQRGRPVITRPSSYRAPSWSWASLNGPISAGSWMGQEFNNISIRVLDANIKLLDEDQIFGGVQHGTLTIECGQLKRTIIQNDQILLPTEPTPFLLQYQIDVTSSKPSEPIFLLLIDPHSVHFDLELQKCESLEGLMITPTHSGGSYQRFGYFRSSSSGETKDLLSLEDYLALPGVEDKEAYEKIIPGQGGDELRYVISLI